MQINATETSSASQQRKNTDDHVRNTHDLGWREGGRDKHLWCV